LIAEPRDLSLTQREADIALRLARPHIEMKAVARRIGGLSYSVYGPIRRKSSSLPWIAYADAMTDLPQSRWLSARFAEGDGDQSALLVNDAEAVLQAIKAGLGKSLLPIVIAEREPGLKRLNSCAVPLSRELWLMVHPELHKLTRIRVVMDWI